MTAIYDIKEAWPTIRPIIGKAIIKQGKSLTIMDNLYNMCLNGKAFLFCRPGGFAILEAKCLKSELVLFIHAAWGENGKRGVNLASLIGIARVAGAHRLEMWSRRKGFERVGWTVKEQLKTDYIYTREV